MCGRITQRISSQELADFFGLPLAAALQPRFNIAPTQRVAVVRRLPGSPQREVALLRWGLVPHWADNLSVGSRMINARSEGVAKKPAFRQAFRERRCLVPADGFYEWKKSGRRRDAFLFTMSDGKPFGLAGLWESKEIPYPPPPGLALPDMPPAPVTLETFTILTTEANALLRPLHERMPVIVERRDFETWLDPEVCDPALLKPLLRPYAAELMACRAVSSYVNKPGNEGARCLDGPEKDNPTLWDV